MPLYYYASSYYYICVLVLLYIWSPHSTTHALQIKDEGCGESYYMCPHTAATMCPHTTATTCVLILLLLCVLILLLLHVSSYYCYYMCPHTPATICVLILLDTCPHTSIYVSSYRLKMKAAAKAARACRDQAGGEKGMGQSSGRGGCHALEEKEKKRRTRSGGERRIRCTGKRLSSSVRTHV